ncbi:MAG: PIG-L family deacetylase [Clostridiales bacterium]|nr:PIG-L family deacetylase [Clostridiales bacterium]
MYRYMVIGAHPDDCEYAAGIALKLLDLGQKVKFLTATNGCSGHYDQMGGAIAVRRKRETEKVAALVGVEYEMLEIDDGSLTTGLAERKMMMCSIREFNPDVILTHRPCDYHPDHRATSMLVQDCSFMVQVPNVCPLTPAMDHMPAVFYMQDFFKKPYPFQPDLVFDIDSVFDRKMEMLHQHTSQMYEWLPWVDHNIDPKMPDEDDNAGRLEWLKRTRGPLCAKFGEDVRDMLVAKYGEAGRHTRYIEALELCEYGEQLTKAQLDALFPF